jgi:hypothetical protein
MPEPTPTSPLPSSPVSSLSGVLAQAKDLGLLEQLALFRADQQRRWLLGDRLSAGLLRTVAGSWPKGNWTVTQCH